MVSKRTFVLLILTSLLAVGLAACGSDDDPVDPGGGGTDSTAPQVAGVDPNNDETGVGQSQAIIVTFNEAMDPATAAGNVSLSAGTVTSTSWDDDRNLRIMHTPWAEGIEVTLTVGTGLADVAGNNLAAAFTTSFYVFSSNLLVLETTPADGATDVNRASNVQILFSGQINEASVAANTTITSGLVKVDHAFTVESDNSTATLVITDNLPASTAITVTLGANIAAQGGGTLGAAYVFSFTTGVDVDLTPPTILSVSPANGSTVAPDAGIFRVTFSEPINPDSFSPSEWNVEFALALAATDPTPTWSNNNTVVAVPLPSPLPAGLPIEITFAEITDANGVLIAAPWTFEAAVAGAPDYYPMSDGLAFAMGSHDEGGVAGNSTPQWTDDFTAYLKWDEQSNGTFHLAYYASDFVTPLGEYDIIRRLGNQVQWVGFAEDGGADILFDTPMEALPLPLAPGTWNTGTNVTIPGEGTFTASLNGTVVGQFDVPIDGFGNEDLFYKDAWQVIRHLEVEMGTTMISVQDDTTWYSATLGQIKANEYEDQIDAGEWSYLRQWRILDLEN